MIDFTLTPEQRHLRSGAQTFAQNVLAGARATYSHLPDQTTRFQSTLPIYRSAVKAGLIKGQIPAALGGTGGPLLDAAILVEELYAVEPGASLTIFGTGLGLTPLILAGSDEQKARLLKPFLTGEGEPLASLMHSEPAGTANWLERGGKGLQTTARKEGNEWVINGEKVSPRHLNYLCTGVKTEFPPQLWTTNSGGWDGRGAQVQCLVCRHSPDGGAQDPSRDPREAILILMLTPEVIAQNPPSAYEILSEPELAGHIATSGPHTRFNNLRVPDANLLAAPGAGAALVEQTFASSAAIVGAMSVGIMRATFDAALKFAKNDARGGSVPILARQSVADLMMDVKMRADASRLMTWKALHCLQNGPGGYSARLEMALEAKVFCSENAVKSVVDAMKAVGS